MDHMAMALMRAVGGTWSFENVSDDERRLKPDYIDALPRYLTALDPVFERAQSKNEFEFILSLLAVRGLQDAGWSPYETSLAAIDSMVALHNETSDFKTGRHLKLWIYGHIVEASEPYELVANLFAIIAGGRYRIGNFPAKRGRPPSPGQKLEQLEPVAVGVGTSDAIMPLKEVWDRDLRNA